MSEKTFPPINPTQLLDGRMHSTLVLITYGQISGSNNPKAEGENQCRQLRSTIILRYEVLICHNLLFVLQPRDYYTVYTFCKTSLKGDSGSTQPQKFSPSFRHHLIVSLLLRNSLSLVMPEHTPTFLYD